MRDITEYKYIFITCEGTNEEAVFNYIEQEGKFVISDPETYSKDFIKSHTTNSRKRLINTIFEHSFDGPVAILDIRDRIKEDWKINKRDREMMARKEIDIIPVVTYPEIEILLINNDEECYKQWVNKKNKFKPSEFCKMYYNDNVKDGKSFLNHFSSFEDFEKVCNLYKADNGSDEYLTLSDLIAK